MRHFWDWDFVFSLNGNGFLGWVDLHGVFGSVFRSCFVFASFALFGEVVSVIHFCSLSVLCLGALGNSYSFLILGAVPDMWCLSFNDYSLHFNLSDVLLVMGGGIFLITSYACDGDV